MSVDYRWMRADEEGAVLDVWIATNPGTDRNRWRREWLGLPGAWERTAVAVGPGNTILSVAVYWPCARRDARGVPARVGHVSHVATRPEAHRRGHAGRLLDLLVEAMGRDGCAWSLLFTSEEGRSLYERRGWRPSLTHYRWGALGGGPSGVGSPYTVCSFDPWSEPEGWERLAGIYAAYNAARLLTLVREPAYWRGYYATRLGDWMTSSQTTLLAAIREGASDRFCGYILASFDARGVLVGELGVLPDEADAIPALLAAVFDRAAGPGKGTLVRLPNEPAIDAALERLAGPLEQGVEQQLMLRALDPAAAIDDLITAKAPGAVSWLMDEI
jgi:ribosomal protein S18 acetylase RimI-like enzyme